ncbi:hypothetical protein [Flaviflexus huanghaiensis]|uniref:hypothetical protein n=1 Tax=Flaviflexus huanghaiensis TaxID=1111473 RepID=UPI0015FA250F|nr:hypothetical protein [Flaviflexus huanghaiensis]
MEIQGYALFAAVIVLVTVVYPALSWRSRVALATPVEESVSHNLRVINSVDRWTTTRSANRGTILPRVESRMSRVDPNNLRTLATSRARARARVAQRTARMKALGMGVGFAILLTVIAWIVVVAASVTAVLGIVPTVLTVGVAVFYVRILDTARTANAKDQQAIAKFDAKLEKLSQAARIQDRKTKTSKKMPPRVAEARRASAASAQTTASADTASAASAPSASTASSPEPVASGPAVSSAPTGASSAETVAKKAAVATPAARREPATPSYTPKPTFSRRTVKPFEPAEAPTAPVPYRPIQTGEKFSNAPSASSADAAPVIASFSFDEVLEARRRA